MDKEKKLLDQIKNAKEKLAKLKSQKLQKIAKLADKHNLLSLDIDTLKKAFKDLEQKYVK